MTKLDPNNNLQASPTPTVIKETNSLGSNNFATRESLTSNLTPSVSGTSRVFAVIRDGQPTNQGPLYKAQFEALLAA